MAGAIAIGGLVTSVVSSAAGVVQAVAQAKPVFCDPLMNEDDLSDNVEEIIDALNEKVRKLGCIRKDFENEVLRNKIKAPSEMYLEWVHTAGKIDNQVKDLIAEYEKQSKEDESFWFSSSAAFREDFKKVFKKVNNLVQESNHIEDRMFVDQLPELVVNRKGPAINSFGTPGKQIKEIRGLLISSTVKKMGILGTVGIGKTTMMLNLNNDEQVAKNFEIVIWLTVSKEWEQGKSEQGASPTGHFEKTETKGTRY